MHALLGEAVRGPGGAEGGNDLAVVRVTARWGAEGVAAAPLSLLRLGV
ncbi:hypothetical protein [Streptomyces sp. NPDC001307]